MNDTNERTTLMKTETYTVSGMHCGSCSMLVTMSLEDLPGVESVTCDHVSGRTILVRDPELTTDDDIRRAIESSGFSATIAE